jgi:hypothetical protein
VDCFVQLGGTPIRIGQLDLEVEHKILIELKVAPFIKLAHIQQLQKYIKARKSTGLNVQGACLICFTEKERVEFLELDIPQTKSPFFKLGRMEIDSVNPK